MKKINLFLVAMSWYTLAVGQATPSELRFDGRSNSAYYTIDNDGTDELTIAGTSITPNEELGNILQLDRYNNVTWEVKFVNSNLGGILDVDVNHDNNLIAVTGYLYETTITSHKELFVALIHKQTGGIIAKKRFTHPDPGDLSGYTIKISEDGEAIYVGGAFLFEGYATKNYNYQEAVLLKLDQQLDIDWQRRIWQSASCPSGRDLLFAGFNGILEVSSDRIFAYGGSNANGNPYFGDYLGYLVNSSTGALVQDVSKSFLGMSFNAASDAYLDKSKNLLHVLLNSSTASSAVPSRPVIATYELAGGVLTKTNEISFSLKDYPNSEIRGYSLVPSSKEDIYTVIGNVSGLTNPSNPNSLSTYTFAQSVSLEKDQGGIKGGLIQYQLTEISQNSAPHYGWFAFGNVNKSLYTPEFAVNSPFYEDGFFHVVSSSPTLGTNGSSLTVFDLIDDQPNMLSSLESSCFEVLEVQAEELDPIDDPNCGVYDGGVLEIHSLTLALEHVSTFVGEVCPEPIGGYPENESRSSTQDDNQSIRLEIQNDIKTIVFQSKEEQAIRFEIYSTSGKVIQTGVIAPGELEVINYISPGIYIIRKETADGRVNYEKFYNQ